MIPRTVEMEKRCSLPNQDVMKRKDWVGAHHTRPYSYLPYLKGCGEHGISSVRYYDRVCSETLMAPYETWDYDGRMRFGILIEAPISYGAKATE